MSNSTAPAPVSRLVSGILIVIAVASVCGRIVSVDSLSDPLRPSKWPATRPTPLPTLGGNDRSRWDTIRALVDDRKFAIGHRDPDSATEQNKYGDTGIVTEEGWKTYDMVLHPTNHNFYSSKPPLLPLLLAGEYWLLKEAFGWSIVEHPFAVVRTILLTINALPFAIFLVLLARLVERFGATTWGRLYTVAAGCFASFVIPFAIVLNNHTVGTFCALFALYPILRYPRSGAIMQKPADRPGYEALVLSGFFAGFAACNELPAAAFLAAWGIWLLARAPARTLLCFVPAAVLPIAGLLVTNRVAIGEWDLVYAKVDVGNEWYRYEGSYWSQKKGIDAAGQHEDKGTYALHLLVGHHGVFSLSPIFVLALAGTLAGIRPGKAATGLPAPENIAEERPVFPEDIRRRADFRALSWITLFVTVIVVSFYIYKTDNYGGWTCGPRWLMWLTPFWLLTMLPVVDRLARCRWGRGLACVLLAVSVFSVTYPAWNPWRHPWIYDLLEAGGWIKY